VSEDSEYQKEQRQIRAKIKLLESKAEHRRNTAKTYRERLESQIKRIEEKEKILLDEIEYLKRQLK